MLKQNFRSQTSVWPVGNVKKYWCELHRESSYHPRELVLVEMSKNISEDVETIPLETVFKITRKEGLIKEKSIFQIMTSNGKFTLGTDSLEKTEKWIRVLNEEIFGPPQHNVICKYVCLQVKSVQSMCVLILGTSCTRLLM